MKRLLRYAVALAVFSSILGPAAKLPLHLDPINVYLSDILIILLGLIMLFHIKKIFPLFKKDIVIKSFFIFIVFALLTLLVNPIRLTAYEFVVSLLYLIKYSVYFAAYIGATYLITSDKKEQLYLNKYLYISGLLFLVISWLQYFLYPDLRNLIYLGWDPHYKRIFALIFDPNYLGLLLIYFFFLQLTTKEKNLQNIIIALVTLLTIIFTYSRSTYLALIFSGMYYAWQIKKLSFFFLVCAVFIFSLFFLPRYGGASVELERFFSVRERLSNWHSASQIIIRNPLFGIGFNTLRFARREYQELPQDWLTSHSAAGVDNSLLFVAATTGLIGVSIYFYFLFVLFNSLDLLGKSVIIASMVHGLFLNSLFFSFILIWLWIICSLSRDKMVKGSNRL